MQDLVCFKLFVELALMSIIGIDIHSDVHLKVFRMYLHEFIYSIIMLNVQSNLVVLNLVVSISRITRGIYSIPAKFPFNSCVFTSDDSNSVDSKSRITRIQTEVPPHKKSMSMNSFVSKFEVQGISIECMMKNIFIYNEKL